MLFTWKFKQFRGSLPLSRNWEGLAGPFFNMGQSELPGLCLLKRSEWNLIAWSGYLYTYIQPTSPSLCTSVAGTPGTSAACTCPSHSCPRSYTCTRRVWWCFSWRNLREKQGNAWEHPAQVFERHVWIQIRQDIFWRWPRWDLNKGWCFVLCCCWARTI